MPLEAIELPEPRLEPPKALAEMFRADRHDRVSHASARPTATSSAASAASSRTRPTWSPIPRDEPRSRRVLDLVRRRGRRRRSPSAAAPASSAASSRGSATTTRARSRSTCARLDRVLEVDAVSRAARIQAGATGPGARGPAARARADAAPLPAVVRVLDPRRLDRDPRGRPLRDPLHAHRRPGRVGAGGDAVRATGRAAACRAPAPARAPTGC